MDKCPHCGGTRIGMLGDYYHCQECKKLLDHTDPVKQEVENKRRREASIYVPHEEPAIHWKAKTPKQKSLVTVGS